MTSVGCCQLSLTIASLAIHAASSLLNANSSAYASLSNWLQTETLTFCPVSPDSSTIGTLTALASKSTIVPVITARVMA